MPRTGTEDGALTAGRSFSNKRVHQRFAEGLTDLPCPIAQDLALSVTCIRASSEAPRHENAAVLQDLEMAMDRSDVDQIRMAINKCCTVSIPSSYLQQGTGRLQELEALLSELQEAVRTKDLSNMDMCLRQCQHTGIPSAYLEDAITSIARVQLLVDHLASASRARDVNALETALQDCIMQSIPDKYLEEAEMIFGFSGKVT